MKIIRLSFSLLFIIHNLSFIGHCVPIQFQSINQCSSSNILTSGFSIDRNRYVQKFLKKTPRDSFYFTDKSLFYTETDPSALFFNGFTLQVRRSSLLGNKMIIGLGYYRAKLPAFWINTNPQNKYKDWSARVKNGLDFIIDYHFFEPNKSLFTGLALSLYDFEIERVGLRSRFKSLVPSIRLEYLWRPFNNYFYVLPIASVAYNVKISGVNTIAGESLVIKKWAFVPTINLGISF